MAPRRHRCGKIITGRQGVIGIAAVTGRLKNLPQLEQVVAVIPIDRHGHRRVIEDKAIVTFATIKIEASAIKRLVVINSLHSAARYRETINIHLDG